MVDDAEDDARSVRAVLEGDPEAFGALVARHARRLHDLARRILRDATDAEDVVQQAFLNAYRGLAGFDARRPFRHWLLRIATNLCRTRLGERARRPRAVGTANADPSRDLDPVARPDREPGDEEEGDALRVRAAIERLPDTYRVAAVLRYVHGLTLEEIVEITGEPLGTAKIHLFRARAALARDLTGVSPGETSPARVGTKGR